MCSIFQELQSVLDTGYMSALPSLEEYWQQVMYTTCLYKSSPYAYLLYNNNITTLRINNNDSFSLHLNIFSFVESNVLYYVVANVLFIIFIV